MIRHFLALIFCAAALPAVAHDFHASLMVLEHNSASGEAEITLRLFSDDLEHVVKKSARGVRLESPEGEEAVFAYIRKALKLKRGDKPLPLTWVGMQIEVDTAWVYVSCPLKEAPPGLKISNRIFCELFKDQINTVNVKWAKQKRTLTFGSDGGFQGVKGNAPDN